MLLVSLRLQAGSYTWADRYTYIPLIGLFIALVWGLERSLGKMAERENRRQTAFTRPCSPAALLSFHGRADNVFGADVVPGAHTGRTAKLCGGTRSR